MSVYCNRHLPRAKDGTTMRWRARICVDTVARGCAADLDPRQCRAAGGRGLRPLRPELTFTHVGDQPLTRENNNLDARDSRDMSQNRAILLLPCCYGGHGTSENFKTRRLA